MLYHFLNPSTHTSAQPVEGAPPVPGLNPYYQSALPAAFRLPDDGGKPEDKEKEKQQSRALVESKRGLPEGMPEMFRLVLNSDFQDFFHFFMTPQHDEIIQLRNDLRQEKGVSNRVLYRADIIEANRVADALRRDVYEFTFQYFYSPMGAHCQYIA